VVAQPGRQIGAALIVREYLDALAELSRAREEWKQLARWAIAAWLIFYLVFLAYAVRMRGGFLFIDSANLVVHEAGGGDK
jgi:hypothetical protein